MDARLQIKLNISEYYDRFNKTTIVSMAVSFRWRKVSFPIKEKNWKNTFWIAEKIISVERSAWRIRILLINFYHCPYQISVK